MAIKSNVREQLSFARKVGMFEGSVVAINPTNEELTALLGLPEPIEDAIEYVKEKEVTIGEDEKIMVDSARISVYLREIKTKQVYNVNFYLEDRIKMNKERTKTQYLNSLGNTYWAENEEALPTNFAANAPVREARVGEEELYKFVKSWLNLDYKTPDFTLDLEFDKLIKGDVTILTSMIGQPIAGNVVALATVKTKEKDGEVKHYQGVYAKSFLRPYDLKHFKNKVYDEAAIEVIQKKASKDLKPFERFVKEITNPEYPLKEAFSLALIHNYDETLDGAAAPASEEVLDTTSADY